MVEYNALLRASRVSSACVTERGVVIFSPRVICDFEQRFSAKSGAFTPYVSSQPNIFRDNRKQMHTDGRAVNVAVFIEMQLITNIIPAIQQQQIVAASTERLRLRGCL